MRRRTPPPLEPNFGDKIYAAHVAHLILQPTRTSVIGERHRTCPEGFRTRRQL
jgi:hypothetical protein